MPSLRPSALFRSVLLAAALGAGTLRADPAADLAQLTRNLQALPCQGAPGGIALLGRQSFALAADPTGLVAVAAAGVYRDNPAGGRAVLLAHPSFYVNYNAAQSALMGNLLRWLGRKDSPLVRCGPGTPAAPASSAGFSARVTGGPALPDDLQAADVLILSLHSDLGDDEWELVNAFAARGGGLLLLADPAALDADVRGDAERIAAEYGMAWLPRGPAGPLFPVLRAVPPLRNAYAALVAMAQEKQGGAALSAGDRQQVALTLDQLMTAGADKGVYQRALDQVSKAYGWIALSASNPLARAERPLDALMARYQARQLANLPAEAVPAHPSAADWPGLGGPGEPVKQVVRVDARAPAPALINCGEQGVTRNTGLYARPGQVVTITLPASAVGDGLTLRVGIHTDDLSDQDRWLRCPVITRDVRLTGPVTRVASAFGGLVQILVPPGCSRGPMDLTVEGAVPAPVFRVGTDLPAAWPRLRAQPGAWGYLETSNFCLYVSRRQLMTLENPAEVAAHWDGVISLCDRMLGYAGGRRRGEAALTDIQLARQRAPGGYPIMLPYGDSDALMRNVLRDGDWGFYHELGHTYQDSFDDAFVIGAAGEAEGNLVPGLLMSLLHRRSPWDGDVQDTFDADARLRARQEFQRLPPEQRTWDRACRTAVGADFYFGLAEAFGWDLYGRAFTRLRRFLGDPSAEPDLAALGGDTDQARRDRLLLLLCQETGRNLLPYAARYGLGRPPHAVSGAVAAKVKELAVWEGNRPPSSLSMPDTLTVEENLAPGSLLYTFDARDPDPGNLFAYRLARGNEDGAFSLDPRSGELRVVDLDFERAPDYLLAVEVLDEAVPRHGLTNFFEIVVNDVDEAPAFETQVFEAFSRQPAGTALGTLAVTTEDGRALETCALVEPRPAGAFTLDADTRRLRVADPSLLPTNGVLTLDIAARDVAGRQGSGSVFVLANEKGGLRMERWNGHDLANPPAVVGQVDDPTLQASAGSNFTRRLSGWLVPPRNGSYTFWTSGDDAVELFLSSDDQPAQLKRICFNRGPTKPQSWEERPRQRSAPIQLRAGRFYYLEILHREEQGEDHMAVAWEGPGFARELLPRRVLLPHR